MITQEMIDQFYKDVDALGLRFPVAELHRKTGFSKGQISQVLSKALAPSEDLIKEFNKSFKNVHFDNYDLPLGDLKVTLKDYIDLLKEQTRKAEEREKEYLDIIKGKLSTIEANSRELVDDLSALTTEVQAEHRAIMDTVDKAAKQPIGTTAAAADNVELASQEEQQKMGKKAGAHRLRKP